MESWNEIADFPGYSVSDQGQVRNDRSERIMALSTNQRGITMVGLFKERKQHKRKVDLLVARAFLPAQPYPHFDSVIHLDGDRYNSDADNLMWRPRWFTVKYHAQFIERSRLRFEYPLEVIQTGQLFDNSFHMATTMGLLERDIVLSHEHNTYIWPTSYEVRIL